MTRSSQLLDPDFISLITSEKRLPIAEQSFSIAAAVVVSMSSLVIQDTNTEVMRLMCEPEIKKQLSASTGELHGATMCSVSAVQSVCEMCVCLL